MKEIKWKGIQKRKSSKIFNYILGSVLTFISILGIAISQYIPKNLFIGFLLPAFVGLPIIIATEINYRARSYLIDEKGVTEKFNFIIMKKNRVKFKQITNISISKGYFDKKFGTGSIKAHTAGMGSSQAEIEIRNVSNPEEPKKILENKM